MEHTNVRAELNVELWDTLPESKLELIGGTLIVGNSLAGSRYLLWSILQSCGPRAVLPFAYPDLWRQALRSAFRTPTSLGWPHGWKQWARQFADEPSVIATGPGFERGTRCCDNRL